MQKETSNVTRQTQKPSFHPAFEFKRSEPIETLNVVVEEYAAFFAGWAVFFYEFLVVFQFF